MDSVGGLQRMWHRGTGIVRVPLIDRSVNLWHSNLVPKWYRIIPTFQWFGVPTTWKTPNKSSNMSGNAGWCWIRLVHHQPPSSNRTCQFLRISLEHVSLKNRPFCPLPYLIILISRHDRTYIDIPILFATRTGDPVRPELSFGPVCSARRSGEVCKSCVLKQSRCSSTSPRWPLGVALMELFEKMLGISWDDTLWWWAFFFGVQPAVI